MKKDIQGEDKDGRILKQGKPEDNIERESVTLVFYIQQKCFKNKGKVKIFSDIQLKEFITSTPDSKKY